jgi:hypothetical protein
MKCADRLFSPFQYPDDGKYIGLFIASTIAIELSKGIIGKNGLMLR